MGFGLKRGGEEAGVGVNGDRGMARGAQQQPLTVLARVEGGF